MDGTDRDAVSAFLDEFGTFERLVLAFSPGPVGVGPLKKISFADVETAVTAKLVLSGGPSCPPSNVRAISPTP
ncbi:hypothetical protein [Actinoplanes sp. N902-109]|uniref:hypothetical protein n=1 Tax=Actinoplanes sp. (strain N902-109) TaxID=649831 RepID=UPI0003295944|nr:hypothetical protein [Actinoplanes sp. N902-109]AGL17528.1 hypothetical protein L083_4018 [Actinoplanes sp. N902-109]